MSGKNWTRVALMVVVSMFVVATVAMAEAPAAAAAEKDVTLKGMVKVVKAADGKVTGVTLVVEKETYKLVGKDQKALEAMDGKAVEATGIVVAKGAEKTLNVKSVKEAAAPAAPAAPAKPAAPAAPAKK